MEKSLMYQGVIYKNLSISELGKIKNLKTGTVYKIYIGGTGYMISSVTINGKY